MLLEIRGCSRRNKGAELMLIAIQQHFRATNPETQFAVDQWFGPYEDRAAYGLLVRPALKRQGRGSLSLRLMPSSLKSSLGIVEPIQVDAALDAAGFAYGDIHGPGPTEALADEIAKFKKQRSRPFVLLPQAFGPFTTPRIIGAMLRVAAMADRIYARDAQSFQALTELCGIRGTIRMAPDFTAVVEPDCAKAASGGKALVIPNARMLDKTESSVAEGYVPLLIDLIARLSGRSIETAILLHDRDEDAAVAQLINARLQHPLEIVSAEDPLRLKGLIRAARLIIGSRFHGLVGALSQAVPAIGIGWSHKYEELFGDYGCPDCLLPVGAAPERIAGAVSWVTAQETSVRTLLAERASAQRALIADMWADLDACLKKS